MGLKTASLHHICTLTALPLCSLISAPRPLAVLTTTGVYPDCSARTIEVANTVIFQLGNAIVNMTGLVVISIIILNIRTKYTAIGRKEILDFFVAFLGLTFMSLAIDSGVVPAGSSGYAYAVASQAGMASAVCLCLMVNGILGFQLWEDGTPRAIWTLRGSCVAVFLTTFAVSVVTFRTADHSAVLSTSNTAGLFVALYVFNAVFLAVYVVSQVVLTIFFLKDLWSLGAVVLGTLFFVFGQFILYALSQKICTNVKHYLDGLFFASLSNLFAAMMIYKYWDMITTEDLEFSVNNKESAWEVKDVVDDGQMYTLDSAGIDRWRTSQYTGTLAFSFKPPYQIQ